jgi:hypothetical protein
MAIGNAITSGKLAIDRFQDPYVMGAGTSASALHPEHALVR